MKTFVRTLLVTLLLSVVGSFAQSTRELTVVRDSPSFKVFNEEKTFTLDSKLMGRKMPYRVIMPTGPGNNASRSPVVYLLHGLTGHFNNWSEKTQIREFAGAEDVIVVMPEGDDGWYTDSSAKANDKYETYLVTELIPEIDKKFRTIADREYRAIAGLSMGGFGAIKFGLKYPQLFALAGSFSGALGASSYRTAEELPPGGIRTSLVAIFGEAGSPTHGANDIFKMVREASPEKIKAMPFIYLDCGTEDFLFQNNRDFVSLLVEKKVPHEYRQLPGTHDWKYWDHQVEQLLRLLNKRFWTSRIVELPGRSKQ
jgi:putative tributyrin esterase